MTVTPKPKKGQCVALWVTYVKAGASNAEQASRCALALDDLEECRRKIAAMRVQAVARMCDDDGFTLRTAADRLNLSATRVQQFLAEARQS